MNEKLTFFTLVITDLRRLLDNKSKSASFFHIIFMLANPRFAPVLLIRLAKSFSQVPILSLFSPVITWVNFILFGIEVTTKCEIGPGLFLPHSSGIVIGASSIGKNVTLYQGVTLGAVFLDLNYEESARPRLGDDVVVGSGAKVLGGIIVGDNARIGANAVVLENVPSDCTAAGVPAVIRKKNEKTSS